MTAQDDAPGRSEWALPAPDPAGPASPDAGSGRVAAGGAPIADGAPASGWGPAPGYSGPGYAGQGYAGPVPPVGYLSPVRPPVYGQPGPPPGYAVPAWRPAALQPGIVPLRPLGLGEILDGSFRAIRANPRVMFGLSAAVVTVVIAIQAVLTWYVGGLLSGVLDDLARAADPTGQMQLVDQVGSAFASVFTAPFVALAGTLLTGLLIVSVSRSVIGEKISVGEVNRIARGRIWWVVAFTLLLAAGSVVVFALYGGAIALLATQKQWGGLLAVVPIGGVALVLAGVWITVRTLLVPAALMLEGAKFWTTVRRAWRLTRGSFWRLFGIYLLVQVMVSIVVSIIVYPVTVVALIVFQDPSMTSFGPIAFASVGKILGLTLSTAFSAAVIALLYIDVRMRREGLDVELARAAETAK